ncbi:ATPase family associated with various cellular activities (AAA) [Rubripirellula tenax]|uniref:ATPase family associated with various cellular activities (AAA) n=1 Tax=Rubripirellula tenax TaxID=2528015 RepID=A0A5C6E7S6_9BACT|nr:MoxR family ATPase [Rubripirellula tenax]TWU44615.1 ATPase family associated with various cellular activities (AAA) [Rubripirellula tenax]
MPDASHPHVNADSGHENLGQLTAEIDIHSRPFRTLANEVGKTIVGQEGLIGRMIIALLSGGHLLIEGVPGLAKTTAVACLSKGISTGFQRLQFTPDLLPADLIGTQVYRPQTQEFVVQKGPIFSNLILADEINRAPAKVQSALLEAMQERQVTIGGETFFLEEPFMVMATQNPVEQEGTYPLPEAQMDRFIMKVVVDYPNRDEELQILRRMSKTKATIEVESVTTPAEIMTARSLVDRIHVSSPVEEYIVDLVMATRKPAAYGLDLDDLIQYGASPRATINLTLAAKANAFLQGRAYATPEDVKAIAMDVLRHRVIITYEAEAEEKTAEDIVALILQTVPVP